MGSVSLLNQIKVTPLRQVSTIGGDVWQALKCNEDSFEGFGEAYFSWVEPGIIKAWKKHLKMTMNLIVPIGNVHFVFFEMVSGTFREEFIGTSSYVRITVPPRIWFGFQSMSNTPSLVLNLANLTHDPEEVERKSLNEIEFDWRVES